MKKLKLYRDLKEKITKNDYIFIAILAAIFILTILLFSGCNTVHKTMHKQVSTTDSAAQTISAVAAIKHVDSTAKETKQSEYNKMIVELPDGGMISFGDEPTFDSITPAENVRDIHKIQYYKFPAKSKITFEKGSSSETKEVEKKSLDSFVSKTENNVVVNKKNVAVDKQTDKSRLPVIGLIVLTIVMIVVAWLVRKFL